MGLVIKAENDWRPQVAMQLFLFSPFLFTRYLHSRHCDRTVYVLCRVIMGLHENFVVRLGVLWPGTLRWLATPLRYGDVQIHAKAGQKNVGVSCENSSDKLTRC